jgi:hypothetical protein
MSSERSPTEIAINKMLQRIRAAIRESNAPEKEVLEALIEEAECWRMRLEELESES